MKKLSLLLAGLSIFSMSLAGCAINGGDNSQNNHTHTYSGEWTYDDGYHWHAATCEHTSEIKDKENHVFTDWIIDKYSTEYETGLKHKDCSICDYVLTETIEKLEHTHKPGSPVEENRNEPDCTHNGSYDLVIYCIECEQEISREHKTIPATGHQHTVTKQENIINATCTEDGSYDLVTYCTDDNAEISRENKVIPALGHDLIHHFSKEATCTEDGWNEYDTCSRCDYSTKQIIPATGHQHLSTKEENRVEADCTKNGSYDLVTYCTDDNAEISREHRVIPSLGHALSHHSGKPATCTEDGWNEYDTCSRCDYSTYSIIPATGHQHLSIREENRKEPSCTESGSHDLVTYCTDDNVEISREHQTIEALGHNYAATRISPTFEESGSWNYVCQRCGDSYSETIPPMEHNYSTYWVKTDTTHYHICTDKGYENLKKDEADHIFELTYHVDPTYQEGGVEIYTCSVCDFKKTVTLDQLVHHYEEKWSFDDEYHYHLCTDEGFENLPDKKEKHSFGDYIIEKDNTANEEGSKYLECSICGYKKYEIIPSQLDLSINALSFELNEDGESYKAYTLLGNYFSDLCPTTHLYIPDVYNGLPVTVVGTISCNNIIDVHIPSSVKIITDQGFKYNRVLEKVYLSEGLEKIDSCCFEYCSSLNMIELPDSLLYLGDRVFEECASLEYLHIPENVINIGSQCVYNCSMLDTIVYDCIEKPEFGNLSFAYLENLKHVIYGDKVTVVPAYLSSENLETVKLGESVQEIEDNAFWGAVKIQEISLPESMQKIGGSAFYDCTNLTNINFPSSLTKIGKYAFAGCEQLSAIDISKCTLLETLEECVFGGCESITSFVIPNGVKTVEKNALAECSNLKTLTIGTNVETMASDSLFACYKLETINYLAKNLSLDNGAPWDTSTAISHFLIDDEVEYLSANAFTIMNTTSDSLEIVLPDSLSPYVDIGFYQRDKIVYTEYENGLYIGSKSNPYLVLANVKDKTVSEFNVIHKDTRFIASYAFNSCDSLTSIVVPKNVTTICSRAFDGLYNNCSIYISDDVLYIGEQYSGATLNISISSFEKYLNMKLSWYCVKHFFNATTDNEITNPEVPATILEIPDTAFYGCFSVHSIQFQGSKSQWNAIKKSENWYYNSGLTVDGVIHCTDGDIFLN